MNTSLPRPVRPLARLAPLALVLASGAGLGCYRATGITRPDLAAEEIPEAGGDRVNGLKSTAGPGDYYLGNDYVQLALDGAAFGAHTGQFGAPSGGSILDVGRVALDLSFKRVSMPEDMLERMAPVVNQDPDLPLVFDHYQPGGDQSVGIAYLDMTGALLDPKGKLGVPLDAQGRVVGVEVEHRISLGTSDPYFTLTTTLTNHSGSELPIRNLADSLTQHGGGFRFVVPAVADASGNPITNWGVEIPGSDFSAPLASSVRAPMVGLMGAESAGSTFDCHSSLGLMPMGSDYMLVASDPQDALHEDRPRVPGRLVVGGPAVASLPDGQSVVYTRRMYVEGGLGLSGTLPVQTSIAFNAMTIDRADLEHRDLGLVNFSSFGTALRGGPVQTEYRFERYLGSFADPSQDPDPASWLLDRVEWQEQGEVNLSNGSSTQLVLRADPSSVLSGQNQPYRITARNRDQSFTLYQGTNLLNTSRPDIRTLIQPSKTQAWQILESLAPERGDVVDPAGNVVRQLQTSHTFIAREAGASVTNGLQPLRITFAGVGGTADPDMQRTRRLSAQYDPALKAKAVLGLNYAAYQYRAGNQVFGSSFAAPNSNFTGYFKDGSYVAYGTRGPLSYLDSLPVVAFQGQTDLFHQFVVVKTSLPAGWTSFDLPGPTQATTGGYNPGEMLSSALAEGVQVVARTEEDLETDPVALQAEFRFEFDANNLKVTDAMRDPIGKDPFVVGARSSSLGDGGVTALFTPAPINARNGGALPSSGWTLADFLTQAQGSYNIVQRPRGPQGLFTVRGLTPGVALGTGANAWWTQTGPVSLGKREGDFDAIELIRGEYSDADGNPLPLTDPANATAWFNEFLAVRSDWFALLDQQTPSAFTKALGLSAARYSLDTPVGLARTYLGIGSASLDETNLTPILTALKSGAAVASTGPLLDVSIGGVGPGGLVSGPVASPSLTIKLYASDWVPVDEVRVVVNGSVQTVPMSSFTASSTDARLRTATVNLALPAGKDAWVVVEAGVPLTTTGAYAQGTPWAKIMKGIYPLAVTNPIFVDVNGGGYTPPFP